jgi:hypothetical protein
MQRSQGRLPFRGRPPFLFPQNRNKPWFVERYVAINTPTILQHKTKCRNHLQSSWHAITTYSCCSPTRLTKRGTQLLEGSAVDADSTAQIDTANTGTYHFAAVSAANCGRFQYLQRSKNAPQSHAPSAELAAGMNKIRLRWFTGDLSKYRWWALRA